MFWRIVGIVALVWIAVIILSAVIGVLVKGLFTIAIISLVVFGIYSLVKGGNSKNTVTRS